MKNFLDRVSEEGITGCFNFFIVSMTVALFFTIIRVVLYLTPLIP